jgi:hypothetical protein
MSKISKYNQAVFACSAIVIASLGSFVQSASAGIGSDNGNPIPVTPITPVTPVTIQSNPGNIPPTVPVKPPVTIGSDNGNPTVPVKPPVTIGSDNGNPTVPVKPPVTIGSDNGNPTVPVKPPVTIGSDNGNTIPNGSNAGGISTINGSNGNGNSSDAGGGRFTAGTIATSKGIQGRFLAAMSKYETAAANLAAAEAGQNNASSGTSPVRYGREPGDIAACGCPNADLTAAAPTKELLAAKAAEAEAAAELASAKAEARQFLESVKASDGAGLTTFQPIW